MPQHGAEPSLPTSPERRHSPVVARYDQPSSITKRNKSNAPGGGGGADQVLMTNVYPYDIAEHAPNRGAVSL